MMIELCVVAQEQVECALQASDRSLKLFYGHSCSSADVRSQKQLLAKEYALSTGNHFQDQWLFSYYETFGIYAPNSKLLYLS